jgi:glycosyltransferase involved in cell wall biosynthesis
MRIGYLHLGPPGHGVPRLGVILAAEARKRPSLSVVEVSMSLTGKWRKDRAQIVAAARQLSTVDVVHLQYNSQREKCVWGRRWRQLYHLRLFARTCRRPVVVQISDFYPRRSPKDLLWHGAREFSKIGRTVVGRVLRTPLDSDSRFHLSAFLKEVRNTFGPVGSTVRWLARHSRVLIVCSDEEERRLKEFVGAANIRMIFLFAEERISTPGVEDAKAALGLTGRKVLTLLGFVHPRKGHKLLLQALAELPSDFSVVFAGRAREESTRQDVIAFARQYGVEDRLRLTGYLSEEELERYMAATDLAVCPFETAAASSSINTWISVARPILASDLPLIAEYNRFERGAIRTFSPYTAAALAQAIRQAMETRHDALAAVNRLRDRVTISEIFNEHLNSYREAVLDPRSAAYAVGAARSSARGTHS